MDESASALSSPASTASPLISPGAALMKTPMPEWVEVDRAPLRSPAPGQDAIPLKTPDHPANDSTMDTQASTPVGGVLAAQPWANEVMGVSNEPHRSQTFAPASTLAYAAIAAGAGLLLWALWQWRARVAAAQRRDATRRQQAPGILGASVRVQAHAEPPMHDAVQQSVPEHMPAQSKSVEAADALARELDVRTQQLAAFIEQADVRIAELQRLREVAVAHPEGNRAHSAQRPRAAAPSAVAGPARTDVLIEAKPTPTGLSMMHAAHRDIYELADQGLTPIAIAQRLSKPTGQVELILNLRKAAMA